MESAGKDGQTRFSDIAHVGRVQSLVNQLMENQTGRGTPSAHAPGEATTSYDLASQLERLAKLKSEGHLSDDEYARAKAKLL